MKKILILLLLLTTSAGAQVTPPFAFWKSGGPLSPDTMTSLQSGLVAYWPLSEASGNQRSDIIGGHNMNENGAIGMRGGPYYGSRGADFYDIAGRYLSATHNSNLRCSQSFTFSMWAMLLGAGGSSSDNIITKDSSATAHRELLINLTAGSVYFYLLTNSGATTQLLISSSTAFQENHPRWVHIIAMHDSAAKKMYLVVDGVYDSTTYTGTVNSGNAQLLFGNNGINTTNFRFEGRLSEVGFWNRKLNPDEVRELRRGTSYPFILPVNRIVHEGNSITDGWNIPDDSLKYTYTLADTLAGLGYSMGYYSAATAGDALTFYNGGLKYIANQRPYQVDTAYSELATSNILVIWAGTNDMTDGAVNSTQCYDSLKAYCLSVKAMHPNWKIVVPTMLPRTDMGSIDSIRLNFNAFLRADYSFADALADVGGDATIGDAADAADTTYYGDGVHPTPAAALIIRRYIFDAIQPFLQ